MRLFLPAMLVLAAPAGAATRQFTVGSFERVRVTGPYSVTISPGSPRARATGERGALDRLVIEVQAGTLIVRPERPSTGGTGDSGSAEVELSTPAIEGATLLGSGDLRVHGPKGRRFSLIVTGAGNATVDGLAVDQATLAANGSGNVAASGRAEHLQLQMQGAGGVDAATLQAQDAVITLNGAGRVVVAVAREARVVALGSGEVEVTGRPRCTVRAGGSARVRCGSNQH